MMDLVTLLTTLMLMGSPSLGAQPALTAFQGGTGTTTPSGILYGDESIRLKTVGIGQGLSFTGGTLIATLAGSDWIQDTTYNELSLTPSTTIPVWFKDSLYASSTAFFSDRATFYERVGVGIDPSDTFEVVGSIFFNRGNADNDWRWAGTTDSSAFWADAGLNAISIGKSANAPIADHGKLQVHTDYDGVAFGFRRSGGTNNPGLFILSNESDNLTEIRASGTVVGDMAFALGANEYMRIVKTSTAGDVILGGTTSATADTILSQDGSAVFNEQGNSSTFRVEASGVSDAFQVNGADGVITLGELTVGFVKSDASGVLSEQATIDISDDTNLAVTAPITLTGDTIGLDQSAVDHGSLAGLSDDDHTQYLLLAGRSGGQTAIGGTASGNDLTLQSTSNATKGSIFFGAAQASEYDETNERFGFNQTSPTATADINGIVRLRKQAETTSAGANTITPTHSYIEITPSGGTPNAVTLGEGSAQEGDTLTIVVVSGVQTVSMSDTAGVQEMAGNFSMGIWDSISFIYVGDRWVENRRSNN